MFSKLESKDMWWDIVEVTNKEGGGRLGIGREIKGLVVLMGVRL